MITLFAKRKKILPMKTPCKAHFANGWFDLAIAAFDRNMALLRIAQTTLLRPMESVDGKNDDLYKSLTLKSERYLKIGTYCMQRSRDALK